MRASVRQQSIAEQLVESDSSLSSWRKRVGRLVTAVYPHDSSLARSLEKTIGKLTTIDLVCIGTDDPTAPAPEAAAREILHYIFERWPESKAEFTRLIARTDQL